jgi:hypothetical protein
VRQPGAALEQPAIVSQPAGHGVGWSKQAEPSAHCQSQPHDAWQSRFPAQLSVPSHVTAHGPAPHVTSELQLWDPLQLRLQAPADEQSTSEQALVPEHSTSQASAASQKMPAWQLSWPVHSTLHRRARPHRTAPVQVEGASQCTIQSKSAGHAGTEPSARGSISQTPSTQPAVQASGHSGPGLVCPAAPSIACRSSPIE